MAPVHPQPQDGDLGPLNNDIIDKAQLVHQPMGTELDALAPPVSEAEVDLEPAKVIRRVTGLMLWRNWDRLFDR